MSTKDRTRPRRASVEKRINSEVERRARRAGVELVEPGVIARSIGDDARAALLNRPRTLGFARERLERVRAARERFGAQSHYTAADEEELRELVATMEASAVAPPQREPERRVARPRDWRPIRWLLVPTPIAPRSTLRCVGFDPAMFPDGLPEWLCEALNREPR